MKKVKTACALAVCMSFFVTGCGSAIPDMTKEQEAVISEYAAGLLLKYDKNYNSKLVDTAAYYEEKQAQAENPPAPPAEQPPEEEEKKQAPDAEFINKAQEEAPVSIEEFFELDGFKITYSGNGVYDSYPELSGDEVAISVTASPGSKMFVLFLDVENISGGDLALDMMSKSPRLRVSVNGQDSRNSLISMLQDEFATFMGTIPAGTVQRLVIVTEMPEAECSSIESIALTMRSDAGSTVLNLQ